MYKYFQTGKRPDIFIMNAIYMENISFWLAKLQEFKLSTSLTMNSEWKCFIHFCVFVPKQIAREMMNVATVGEHRMIVALVQKVRIY